MTCFSSKWILSHSTWYKFPRSGQSLLAGSRVRTQENIAEEIAATLPPADLLDVIEDGDAQRLATLLDRDLSQVTRVLTYLRDHPDLYSLEDKPFDDILEITMYDHGQPKSVESLSDGQKATALLPLILRGASCPLIIDQPEDDLDNSFVFQVLVKNILKLKQTRQLVFVTHNANIPVLGDAETVVVMHMERPSNVHHRTRGIDVVLKSHALGWEHYRAIKLLAAWQALQVSTLQRSLVRVVIAAI